MATLDESLTAKTPLGGALGVGLDSISYFQEITLTKYVRIVLPADGFIFWVNAGSVSPSAMLNTTTLNTVELNQPQTISSAAPTLTVKGSLHYATTQDQEEEQTFSTNRVVLSSQSAIQEFNTIGPNELYIGTFENIRFAFSSRGSFYQQADLWHYAGNAIYADMVTQIVDDPRTFNINQLIVSNSLPIWLAMNAYQPVDWAPFANPVPLYPSYLAPLNLAPPFGSVHIEPETTRTIAIGAVLDSTLSETQFCEEMVKITLTGLNNNSAQDFIEFVLQQSNNNPGLFGITNSPVVRDEKRTQPELRVIAQRKTVEFKINYYQSRTRNLARQLILSAVPSFALQP